MLAQICNLQTKISTSIIIGIAVSILSPHYIKCADVISNPNILLKLESKPSTIKPGGKFSYYITINNKSDSSFKNIKLVFNSSQDEFKGTKSENNLELIDIRCPSEFECILAQKRMNYDNSLRSIIWNIKNLRKQTSQEIKLLVRLSPSSTPPVTVQSYIYLKDNDNKSINNRSHNLDVLLSKSPKNEKEKSLTESPLTESSSSKAPTKEPPPNEPSATEPPPTEQPPTEPPPTVPSTTEPPTSTIDIKINQNLKLAYNPTITSIHDQSQGDLIYEITNNSSVDIKRGVLKIRVTRATKNDTVINNMTSLFQMDDFANNNSESVDSMFIQNIGKYETWHIYIRNNWHAAGGHYRFIMNFKIQSIEGEELVQLQKEYVQQVTIYTIPKWNNDLVAIAEKDTFDYKTIKYDSISIPVIPFVFFDPNSAELKIPETKIDSLSSPLPFLKEKLKQNNNIRIYLQGYTDTPRDRALKERIKKHKDFFPPSDSIYPTSMDTALALKRALSVKAYFADKDIKPMQVNIISKCSTWQKIKNPSLCQGLIEIDKKKAKKNALIENSYIDQENRCVAIYNDTKGNLISPNVFGKRTVFLGKMTERNSITLKINVNVYAPFIKKARLVIEKTNGKPIKEFNSFKSITLPDRSNITSTVHWNCENADSIIDNFIKSYNCYVEIVDETGTEQRVFRTRLDTFTVKVGEKSVLMDQIVTIYDFDTVKPVYHKAKVFFDPLIKTIRASKSNFRIEFHGYSDIIGSAKFDSKRDNIPDPDNPNQMMSHIDLLSRQRALALRNNFEKYLKELKKDGKDFETRFPGSKDLIEIEQLVKQGKIEKHCENDPFKLPIRNEILLLGNDETAYGRNFNRRTMIRLIKLE